MDLLDLCRSNEEVIAALHGGSSTRDLSRIRMAIRYEQKKVREACLRWIVMVYGWI